MAWFYSRQAITPKRRGQRTMASGRERQKELRRRQKRRREVLRERRKVAMKAKPSTAKKPVKPKVKKEKLSPAAPPAATP